MSEATNRLLDERELTGEVRKIAREIAEAELAKVRQELENANIDCSAMQAVAKKAEAALRSRDEAVRELLGAIRNCKELCAGVCDCSGGKAQAAIKELEAQVTSPTAPTDTRALSELEGIISQLRSQLDTCSAGYLLVSGEVATLKAALRSRDEAVREVLVAIKAAFPFMGAVAPIDFPIAIAYKAQVRAAAERLEKIVGGKSNG